jgi:hypothetical protein
MIEARSCRPFHHKLIAPFGIFSRLFCEQSRTLGGRFTEPFGELSTIALVKIQQNEEGKNR